MNTLRLCCVTLLAALVSSAHAADNLASHRTDDGRCLDMSLAEFNAAMEHPGDWSAETMKGNLALYSCVQAPRLLEILDRAFGEYLETNVDAFFEKAHEASLPDVRLSGIVAATSETVDDDFNAQLDTIQKRRALVQQLNLACCTRERNIALRAIDVHIKFLKVIIAKEAAQ